MFCLLFRRWLVFVGDWSARVGGRSRCLCVLCGRRPTDALRERVFAGGEASSCRGCSASWLGIAAVIGGYQSALCRHRRSSCCTANWGADVDRGCCGLFCLRISAWRFDLAGRDARRYIAYSFGVVEVCVAGTFCCSACRYRGNWSGCGACSAAVAGGSWCCGGACWCGGEPAS